MKKIKSKVLLAGMLFWCASCIINAESIMKYLPANPKLDGTVDYSNEIEKALKENAVVELIGSGNPKKPNIYGLKCSKGELRYAIKIPAGRILKGCKSAVLKRIPSFGRLIVTEEGAYLKGLIIDGNKKAHWPQFKDLGKSAMGILFDSNNVIENCYIFDNPGCAFATYADSSIVRNCKAKNSGYIDIKFSANYYKGKWDQWSGDSFYIRGHNNIVVNCDSVDAFRWDYTTCHHKAGGSIFINCKGKDVLWKTYGFIDIEGCDGDGSIMINCKSPDGSIAISTSNSKLINCAGNRINVYSTDNVLVAGCETYGGGIAVGGWCSNKKSYIRGGANPIVVNNIINRDNPGPGVHETSDWSLSVFSTNGKGIAAGNSLIEYKGKMGRGPGMKFDKVKACGNSKKYGVYKRPVDKYKSKIQEKIREMQAAARLQKFGAKVAGIAKKAGIKDKIIVTKIVDPKAMFIKDTKNIGEKQKWFIPSKRPASTQRLDAGQHWDNVIGKYNDNGWYFLEFPLDMDDQHICDSAYILFEGVDSECKVWLNGKFIGKHKGWKDPFKIKVPFKLLKWQDNDEPNILVVKVYTPAGIGGLYGNIAAVMTKTK